MKPLYIFFIIVLSAQIVFGSLIFLGIDNWPDRGTFGDMFGAVNTLFSGLAFCGVIYAILLQKKELELQREELSLTREELKKSAVAQQEQAELMLQNSKMTLLQTKIEALSQMAAAGKNIKGSSRIQLRRAYEELQEILEENA